jgi:hypothetical protein
MTFGSWWSENAVIIGGDWCARIMSALPQSPDVGGAQRDFVLVPILLQKSQICRGLIFPPKTIRPTTVDRYSLNHPSEVAREFFVRR